MIKKLIPIYLILLLSVGCKEDNKEQDHAIIISEQKDTIVESNDIDSINIIPVEFNDYLTITSDNKVISKEININEEQINDTIIINAMDQLTSIIPDTPTLGGKFIFLDIKILDRQLLLANYEDGHKGGYLLVSYKKIDNKKIVFTPLKVKKY